MTDPEEPGPEQQDPDQDAADAPGDDGQIGADPGAGGEQRDERPVRAGAASLAEVTDRRPPSQPPRRTGVFLDPEDLREHVGSLLRVMLGGYQVDAWGNFTFMHEDARVFVTIGPSPVGPTVGVFSVTNLDVELTPPMAGFLLTTNHRLGFGAFSYDPDNQAVWLRHTLLGTTLDGPELHSAVAAIASTAAHFDGIIADRFGGRTFAEAPDDVQEQTHPPDPGDSTGPAGAGGYL